MLKALCAGFAEGTEPSICLNSAYNDRTDCKRPNECWTGVVEYRVDPWRRHADQPPYFSFHNRTVTACVDTFRCVCRGAPMVMMMRPILAAMRCAR